MKENKTKRLALFIYIKLDKLYETAILTCKHQPFQDIKRAEPMKWVLSVLPGNSRKGRVEANQSSGFQVRQRKQATRICKVNKDQGFSNKEPKDLNRECL